MDRMIYIAMSGAQQALAQQTVTAHNLANAATTGYKAETSTFRVAPVIGPGLPTRAYAVETTTGADLAPGVQGVYMAKAPGTTTLGAIGRPVCTPGSICPQYRIAFTLTVHVR